MSDSSGLRGRAILALAIISIAALVAAIYFGLLRTPRSAGPREEVGLIGYLSPQRRTIFVTAGQEAIVARDFKAEILSPTRWLVKDKGETVAFRIERVEGLVPPGLISYVEGEERKFNIHAHCVDKEPASNEECVSRSDFSYRRHTAGYSTCVIVPGREGSCTEKYVKIGTEDIYAQPNCVGTPKSSDVLEWVCIP